jgi:hypothetical protein
MGSGRRAKYPALEEQLHQELEHDRHTLGLGVTLASLQVKMKQLVRDTRQDFCFKASSGWAKGFKKRFNLVIRVPLNKVAAKDWIPNQPSASIPATAIEKIKAFHEFKDKLMINNGYLDCNIVNIDQTPVYFDNHYSKTLDWKGNNNVTVKTMGDVKARVTVMLAATADGKLLDPCIVEKGASKDAINDPAKTRYSRDGITVWKQKTHSFNSNLMVDYIDNFLSLQFKKDDPKLLILDSFPGHRTVIVKEACKRHNFDMVMIPGGCTKYLQPLDLTVNRSFKAKLKHGYSQDLHCFTGKEPNQSRVKMDLLVKNVKKARDLVSCSTILNGFKSMDKKKVLA